MHSNNSQNSGKGYLAYYSFIIAKGYKIEPTKGKDIRARSGRISNMISLAPPLRSQFVLLSCTVMYDHIQNIGKKKKRERRERDTHLSFSIENFY